MLFLIGRELKEKKKKIIILIKICFTGVQFEIFVSGARSISVIMEELQPSTSPIDSASWLNVILDGTLVNIFTLTSTNNTYEIINGIRDSNVHSVIITKVFISYSPLFTPFFFSCEIKIIFIFLCSGQSHLLELFLFRELYYKVEVYKLHQHHFPQEK